MKTPNLDQMQYELAMAKGGAIPRFALGGENNWEEHELNHPFGWYQVHVPKDESHPEHALWKAYNAWINSNLKNYVKKQMGTEHDPIRKLAEEGVLHMEMPDQNESQELKHQESLAALHRGEKNDKYPAGVAGDRYTRVPVVPKLGKRYAKSPLAKYWENLADSVVFPSTIESIKSRHNELNKLENVQLERTEPWMMKADPRTTVKHWTSEYALADLGFDHVLDILKHDLTNGRIRPEALNKVSVADAIRRVHEYNEERKRIQAETALKQTEGMPVVKQYPTGHKWIELKMPEPKIEESHIMGNPSGYPNLHAFIDSKTGQSVSVGATPEEATNLYKREEREKQLQDALKYEGDVMGHCVGSYCPEVMEGSSRIFSLRDSKGEPHVTIETRPKSMVYSDLLKHLGGNEELADDYLAKGHQARNYGTIDKSPLAHAMEMAGVPQLHDIIQIKGKQNLKPKAQYIPMVQDFVKSGNWNRVGDFKNTDLIDLQDTGRGQKIIESTGKRFVTPEEHHELMYNQPNGPVKIAAGGIIHKSKGGTMAKGGLFSAVDQGAQNIKRKEGPGQAFLNELMKQPNVKKDELEDRGLTALAAHPKLTKEQMLRELQMRQAPQIQERILKHSEPDEDEVRELAYEIFNRDHENGGAMRWDHAEDVARENIMDRDMADQPQYSEYTLPGGENYREMLLHLQQDRWNPQNNFKSSHYGVQNILAHMRMKDRQGPAGEKLLHLEELQSDWHQHGRDYGYKTMTPEERQKNVDTLMALKAHKHSLDPIEQQEFARLQQLFEDESKKVPNGPFKNNWHEMALKHLIHHAAKNGYHGITVTPGKEQADRYNLERHIGSLHYQPSHKLLEAFNPEGESVLSKIAEPHELPDYIGKDVADRLIKAEPVQGVQKLSGLDLRSGGEGMREFYDKKVPNTFNKLGKKYGAQMGTTQIPAFNQNAQKFWEKIYLKEYGDDPERAKERAELKEPSVYKTVHHFPITDQMRQDITQHGQPMYDHGGVVHKAEGGTMNTTPSMAEMRLALLRSNPLAIQSYGANEAPGMNPKAYVPPDIQQDKFPPPGGAALPTGGIDTDPTQAGQQLMPQQQQGVPPSPTGVAGQPAPQGLQGQGSPLQQPPSNILQMTPQGQALNAIKPPQVPQAPQRMKDGDRVTKRDQTVKNAQRIAYPGIYKRPDVIAAEAAAKVAPEDEALHRLFGVTREDLFQMGKERKGNLPGDLPGAAANPRGSMAAEGVMTPRNTQRILDTMAEAEKHHALVQGMDPWYIMDPVYKRMAELIGPEAAAHEYNKMNHLMGMSSPGSEVNTEIPRGTAAYFLDKQGRFGDFVKYAGKPAKKRKAKFPEDIRNVPGHAYHKTAQALPMAKYLESGEMMMKTPKVPMYIQASGVPETGFQTATPVGDAHWSRAVGLADTRNWATVKGKQEIPKGSVTNPEMTALAPWWREHIAGKLGLESVPAQARAWGAFSPQTGVTTPIGAPKLELLAKKIMETAHRMGVSPETARDYVLTGKTYAGKKEGGDVSHDTMQYELTMKKKGK